MDAKQVRLLLLLWLLMTGLCHPLIANASSIVLVSHRPMAAITQLADLLREQLDIQVDTHTLDDDVDWTQYSIVMLAGEQALNAWPIQPRSSDSQQSLISVWSSREAVLKAETRLTINSALYSDPPLYRQLRLAHLMLGRSTDLGVLLNEAPEALSELVPQDKRSKRVNYYDVKDYRSLNRALSDALNSSDALVGVYSSRLFSTANIKNILISAYRQRKPLIGPTASYIKAGALASTYSSVGDTAKRLGEILKQGLRPDTPIWEPAGFNPYFSLAYNPQVARSLNIALPDKDKVLKQLMTLEHPLLIPNTAEQ